MTSAERLAGPIAKVARAEEHIFDLYAKIKTFSKAKPCVVRRKTDRKAKQRILYLARLKPIPEQMALISGDSIHNLRSALDLLAVQLVCVHEGRERLNAQESERIYFPIGWDREKYRSSRSRQEIAARIRPEALEHIDRIEPYRGGKGHVLWALHQLDITDKHRLLLATGGLLMTDIVTTDVRRSAGIPAHWAAQVHKIFRAGPIASPPIPVRLRQQPLPGWRPLQAGDVLLRQPLDAQTYEQTDLKIEVAFNEPSILKPEPALKTLKEMGEFIRGMLPTFSGLLET